MWSEKNTLSNAQQIMVNKLWKLNVVENVVKSYDKPVGSQHDKVKLDLAAITVCIICPVKIKNIYNNDDRGTHDTLIMCLWLIQLSSKSLKQTHQSKQSRSFQFGHTWGYELEKSKVENCWK